MKGGRGSGKTRGGAETLRDWILEADEPGDWAVVAPTFGDARDTCMEGESGLLRALRGAYDPRKWNRSMGTLTLLDGSRVYLDGADDGALRIQGKNLHGVWCDEIGLWRDWERAWKESLRFAVRLAPARYVVTGTPKQGHPLVRQVLADKNTIVTSMRMIDNLDNLDSSLVAELVDAYEGTRLGRQELEGEFLDEPMGALWSLAELNQHRVTGAPFLDRIVVGVDPSGTPSEDTGVSETGIVVAGVNADNRNGYVIADTSAHASPQQWGQLVVDAYNGVYTAGVKADLVVAEKNFGGEMVRATINAIDPHVPVKLVTASRGKWPRAEPVAAKYEQGRVHHVGEFSRLEEQMVSWVPGDPKQASPDRMDALVWALTELMINQHGANSMVYRESLGDEREYVRGDLVLVGDRYHDRT